MRSTSYSPFLRLRLTYRVVLRQDGDRIFGDGEKWEENGRRLPPAQRTPIHLAGQVTGREIRLRFTEQGRRRDSAGSLRWRLAPAGDRFAGSFASDAASTSGTSAASRLPKGAPRPPTRAPGFVRRIVMVVKKAFHS